MTITFEAMLSSTTKDKLFLKINVKLSQIGQNERCLLYRDEVVDKTYATYLLFT